MHNDNKLLEVLFNAINAKDVEATLIEIKNCLKNDISLDDSAMSNHTLLHWASLLALSDVTKQLLEYGATPDIDIYPSQFTYDGENKSFLKRMFSTPLSFAITVKGEGVVSKRDQECIKIIKILIEYGADVNGFLNFVPPIMLGSCLVVAKTLLNLGADVQQIFNDRLQADSLPSMSAILQSKDKARLLLWHGAVLPKYDFYVDKNLTAIQFAEIRSITDSAEYASRIFQGELHLGRNLFPLERLDVELILQLVFLGFAQAGFKINGFLNRYNADLSVLPEVLKARITEMAPAINYAHAVITLNSLAEEDKIKLTPSQETLLIDVITIHLQRSKNSPITNSSFEEFYQFICDNPILEPFIDKAFATIFPTWGKSFKNVNENLQAQLQVFLGHYLNLTQPKSFPVSLPYDALNWHSTMLRGTAEEIEQKQKDIIKTKTSYDNWLGFAGSFYGIFISCLKKPYKHEISNVSALQKQDIFSQIIFLRRLETMVTPFVKTNFTLGDRESFFDQRLILVSLFSFSPSVLNLLQHKILFYKL